MDSKKMVIWISGVVLFVILGGLTVYAYQQKIAVGQKNNEVAMLEQQIVENNASSTESIVEPTKESCVGDSCLSVDGLEYPAGQLPKTVSDAVKAALDDEYKAYTVYDTVISNIGSVRPFSMIIRAEESHIASLKSVLDKYGEVIPSNPYSGKLTVKNTLTENCQIGVDAEIANIALYRDQLLPKAASYSDITVVFNSLMSASKDKHLPAFEKCN